VIGCDRATVDSSASQDQDSNVQDVRIHGDAHPGTITGGAMPPGYLSRDDRRGIVRASA
jgi:hypothetical protein